MFEYIICNVYDDVIFKKQCSALEKRIPDLTEKNYLEDVDGSQIKLYERSGKQLKIVNDKLVGVIIESDFDIMNFFDN